MKRRPNPGSPTMVGEGCEESAARGVRGEDAARPRRSRDGQHEERTTSTHSLSTWGRRIAEVKRSGARVIELDATAQLQRERRLRQGVGWDEATRFAAMTTRIRAEGGVTEHVAMGLSQRHGEVVTVRAEAAGCIAMVPTTTTREGRAQSCSVDEVDRCAAPRTTSSRRRAWGDSAFRSERLGHQ